MANAQDPNVLLDVLIRSAHDDEPSEEDLRGLSAALGLAVVGGVGLAAAQQVAEQALAASQGVAAVGKASIAGTAGAKVGMAAKVLAAFNVQALVTVGVATVVAGGVWVGAARMEKAPVLPTAIPAVEETKPWRAERLSPPAIPAPEPAPDKKPRKKMSVSAEADLLKRASRALANGKPKLAYRLATRHQRGAPNGVLREERERIAIEALLRLGRKATARRRFTDFQSRYPSSVQTRRLRDLLKADSRPKR